MDEYGVLTRNLFTLKELTKGVRGVIISSVVPPMNWTLAELSKTYFEQRAIFVEPRVKTGMAVLVDNPLEVRIASSMESPYFTSTADPASCDLGTAITFDAISAKGEYRWSHRSGARYRIGSAVRARCEASARVD